MAVDFDTKALSERLARHVQGEVRFDAGARALYSTDSSNYRQIPLGVVLPRHPDDVAATLAACRELRAPVLNRGAGTSLAGQTCNAAVVIDFSKYMNRVLSLDPDARTATVEPGTVLDDLRDEAEAHGLTFGPDPATHNRCTLGGMIGNNSCGVHSVMAGKTDVNVASLDVMTYDGNRLVLGAPSEQEVQAAVASGTPTGAIYRALTELRDAHAGHIRDRYPDIPRCVSGYNLRHLLPEHGFSVARSLVGSEGTCVTVLSAQVELVPSPRSRSLLVLGFT